MTQTDTNDTRSGGNTKTPDPKRKPVVRCRKWCFTLNNYKEDDIDKILSKLDTETLYIFGKEVGKEGTKHIQGYLEFKNAKSFDRVRKLIPRAHFEKTRGSSEQNYKYCSKDRDFISNMDFRSFEEKMKEKLLAKYDDCKWKPWQQQVIDIIYNEPDERTIHWFWEPNGNTGKSFLCKYIALTRKIIIADGKKNDVFNQVNMMMEKKQAPEIIILDIPRSSIGYINYSIIEKLKDGLIYSGKYEGGVCIFPNPHIIIFANTPPNTTELSQDRWAITEIVA